MNLKEKDYERVEKLILFAKENKSTVEKTEEEVERETINRVNFLIFTNALMHKSNITFLYKGKEEVGTVYHPKINEKTLDIMSKAWTGRIEKYIFIDLKED